MSKKKINFFTIQKQKPAIKHEFILLPNILNKQQTRITTTTHLLIEQTNINDAKPMETSKMDISEQQDDIEIEENEVEDEHMKSTHVVDIDENDYDNPQFLSDYVKDIYCYLNQLEVCLFT
jgi:hypothetical protein